MENLEALRKSGNYTSDEMMSYVDAANKMMEEKGMKPLSVPKLFVRKIEIMAKKEKLAK